MPETHAELVAKYSALAARGDVAIDDHLARRSAVFDTEYSRRRRAADDAHAPFDPVAALLAAHKLEATTGDATDSIGSKGHETGNHLAAILRYEGRPAYEKELRRIWKELPDHARRMGFPEPERAGA